LDNRRAWELVVVLAVVVLGGIGLLIAGGMFQLPEAVGPVRLMPRSDWGFGGQTRFSTGLGGLPRFGWFKVGFFELQVK
jgi:hypothetical protein